MISLGHNDYQEVINKYNSERIRSDGEAGTPGRPDFQKSLRNFYDGIQKTRIDFAKRKGWGDPKRKAKLSEGTARSEEVTNNQSDLEGLDTIGVSDPSFLLSPHEQGGTSKMSETQTDQTLELGEMRAKLADAEKHNAQYQARLAELESMNRETAKELRMGQVKARLSAMVTHRDKNGQLTAKITPAIANRVIKLAEVLLDNGASSIKLSEKVKLDDKTGGDGTDKLDVINELLDVLDNVPDSISMNDDSAQLAENDHRGNDDEEDALDISVMFESFPSHQIFSVRNVSMVMLDSPFPCRSQFGSHDLAA